MLLITDCASGKADHGSEDLDFLKIIIELQI